MSKIIYRKIRTAPGVKQYLDDEKTQVNPQFEANSAYFAQAVTLETLSLRDMAKHITSHGSPFTADVVIGVLEAFRSCLIEQLLESKKVKVQGLGTFYVTIANKEGGIKNLADFNINTLATGLRLRFLPEGATEESISSKDFLKKAKFVDVATLTKDKTVSDEEIANAVMTEAGAEGVGVVIKAKHLCMMMRGVEKQNSEMTTSAVLGTFRSDEKVRQEFLSLIA